MSRVSKKVSHDQYVALTEFFSDSDSEKSVSYTLRTGSEGFDDKKMERVRRIPLKSRCWVSCGTWALLHRVSFSEFSSFVGFFSAILNCFYVHAHVDFDK